jgi:hypothetical protein
MIFEPDARADNAFFGVPAIAFAIAGDVSGRWHRIGQRGDARGGAKDKSLELHEITSLKNKLRSCHVSNGYGKVPFPKVQGTHRAR